MERSTQLGLMVSSMLKGYTTPAAKYTAVFLKSVAKFSVQVGKAGGGAGRGSRGGHEAHQQGGAGGGGAPPYSRRCTG